jgi:hypothetical protein
MSTMLDQSIIDANELRKAMEKNAEGMLLERHTTELKSIVENLLNEEDPEEEMNALDFGSEDDLGPAEPNDFVNSIPSAATVGEKLCACPDEDEEIEISFTDLVDMAEEEPADISDMHDRETMADELIDDEDEMEYSDEDYLREDVMETLKEMLGEEMEESRTVRKLPPFAKDDPSDYTIKRKRGKIGNEIDVSGNEVVFGPNSKRTEKRDFGRSRRRDLKRDIDREFKDLDESLEDNITSTDTIDPVPTPDDELGGGLSTSDVIMDINGPEDIMTEEEINEMLKVDVESVSSGNQRANRADYKDNERIELARLQDTRVKEELKELKKNYSELYESNKTISKKYNGLLEVANKIKNKLNEVNTHNAKLLYTNKVLNSASLNERQKTRIVEAIGKTSSVEEAKIIFETLQNAVREISKNKKSPNSLNEAVNRGSSQVILSAGRNKGQKTLDESKNPELQRMQVLAGIKQAR